MGDASNVREISVLNKQLISYSDASRRGHIVMRSAVGHSNVVPILGSQASAPANGTEADFGSPMLRRPSVEARDELDGEVVAVLAHELRNSLCVIRMATGILKAEPCASPGVTKARTLIEHQTAHMSRLVEDLLESSCARAGPLPLKFERLNLCVVAEQALQAVELTMQRRRHSVTVALPSAPIWLQGDPARLEQVFVNILLNAAKYTPSGGLIRVAVQAEEGEAVVRIGDNGIGIAPDVLPRVFELFVRGEPSSCNDGAGLGIGLALVRNLVERHGGCVTAASLGSGHGSEFTVRLPQPSRPSPLDVAAAGGFRAIAKEPHSFR